MTRPFTPREYQHHMLAHLYEHDRCALWCDMGLGKTVTTLSALDSLSLLDGSPALVLAPLRVAQSTWPDEALKWEHLRKTSVMPIVGPERERRYALEFGLKSGVPVFTTNYEQIPWLVENFGEKWPFRTIIADESTRLKSFRGGMRRHPKTGTEYYQGGGGQRARALGRVAHSKVSRFIQLTGTPSPNGLQDLWGQLWFLDGGQRLGRTFEAFTQRWFTPSPDGYGTKPLPFAKEQIFDAVKDICLSISAKDWFDIQQPIVNNIYVDLPAKARRLYRDMEKEMFAEIEGHEVEAHNAAARTMKCLQLANGAAYVDDKGAYKEVHDAKLQALDSIVAEAGGAPILVAYQFKSDLARIRVAFPKARVLDSDPGTIKSWNDGHIPMLLAHPKSAGHGLNLQDGGNTLAFFGHDWNLEEYQQIIERIGPTRQAQAGHPRPVYIHHIIARDTVDELVMARRESKREIQDLLLEAAKRRK